VNLIARLYDAPEGTLFVDGRAGDRLPLSSCCDRTLEWFPRETFLFQRDYPRKLALARRTLLQNDLMRAAEAAHIQQEV